MEIVLLIARVLLAAVFGIAGVAKLVDEPGTRSAIVGFGVPARFAPALARFLPPLEIAVAIALIPTATAWPAAIAAAALLFAFAIGVGVNVARGHSPQCHCFGQLHSAPVSWFTFFRNLMLAGVAGLVILEGRHSPGLSALAWTAELKTTEAISLVLSVSAVSLLAIAAAYLKRVFDQQAQLLSKVDAMKKVIDEDYAEPPPIERSEASGPGVGLPVGAPAPGFSLASVDGSQVSLDDLMAYGKTLLLVFVSPNCAPCRLLTPAIGDWANKYRDTLTVAMLSKGTLEQNRGALSDYGEARFLLQESSDIAARYDAKWSPAALLIRTDGKIATPLAYGEEDIREMVLRAVEAPPGVSSKRALAIKGNGHKPRVTVGTPHSHSDVGKLLPKFSLPDLNGRTISSSDFVGEDTLLLFWDPKCPFCESMSGDIIRWESNPPAGAPRLVLVSSGDFEAVKADRDRFKAQILYDEEFDVPLLFGTNATPSALLIDRDGRIASAPTLGRLNIMMLAGIQLTPAAAGGSS